MLRLILRSTALMATVVVVLGSFMPISSQIASAGANGQQLFIYTMPKDSYNYWSYFSYPGYKKVTVHGLNQNGQYSEWTSNPNGLYGVVTINWWWKGQVRVDVVFTDNRTAACLKGVPQKSSSDVENLPCTYPSTAPKYKVP